MAAPSVQTLAYEDSGAGLIPALTHVGGRDLGDYVSGPDDFVGLVADDSDDIGDSVPASWGRAPPIEYFGYSR